MALYFISLNNNNSLLTKVIQNLCELNDVCHFSKFTNLEDFTFSALLSSTGKVSTRIIRNSTHTLLPSDTIINLSHLDLDINPLVYNKDDYFYTKAEFAAALGFILVSHKGKVLNRPSLNYPFLQLNTFDVRAVLKKYNFLVVEDIFIEGKKLRLRYNEFKDNIIIASQDEHNISQLKNRKDINERVLYSVSLTEGSSERVLIIKILDSLFYIKEKVQEISKSDELFIFFNSYFNFLGLDIALMTFFRQGNQFKFGKFSLDFSHIHGTKNKEFISNIISQKLSLL